MEDTLTRALDVAQEAALAAGAILRDEFHRPDGPRGHGTHAEIDEVVERLIRDQLTTEFPNWGYIGEETGKQFISSDEPYWAVDPNDGTVDFLKGTRGPAVSIALISFGAPILGVVYSYVAPDDDGDMFTWIDGEPISRNGVPQPMCLDSEPGSGTIVLTSLGADKAAKEHLSLIAPGRFRASTSIAYRLALAAVGDGDLAISIQSPHIWDVAGGHALLLGTGGDMWNEHCEEVRYSQKGEMTAGHCVFGGTEKIAKFYLSKPWSELARTKHTTSTQIWHPTFPSVLKPGRSVDDAEVLNRAQGCLLGQIAGDALGSLVEFQSTGQIIAEYPDGGPYDLKDGGQFSTIAGQPTDDSELALMLGRMIANSNGYDEEMAAQYYTWWYNSNPFDIGTTIKTALRAASGAPEGRRAEAARAAASRHSESNGALMRISPLGIYASQLQPADAVRLAIVDTSLTHSSLVCHSASAIFALALGAAIDTGDPDTIYQTALDFAGLDAPSSVLEALLQAQTDPPPDYQTNMGWVLIALWNAFYQLMNAESPEEGIIATVRCGGDTDTNAAICGALLGATWGRDAFPDQWQNMILSCHPTEGIPGILNPRPAPFWPVDIFPLAENLLLAGIEMAERF